MDDGVDENALSPGSLTAILIFRGVIGKGKYFAGLAIVVVILMLAMMALATAMNPTGGGAPFLALPLLLIALYIHLAITVARLRDAGRSPWLALIFVFGPLAWLALSIELTAASDSIWIIVVAGLLAFYAVPGLMSRKDDAAAA